MKLSVFAHQFLFMPTLKFIFWHFCPIPIFKHKFLTNNALFLDLFILLGYCGNFLAQTLYVLFLLIKFDFGLNFVGFQRVNFLIEFFNLFNQVVQIDIYLLFDRRHRLFTFQFFNFALGLIFDFYHFFFKILFQNFLLRSKSFLFKIIQLFFIFVFGPPSMI